MSAHAECATVSTIPCALSPVLHAMEEVLTAPHYSCAGDPERNYSALSTNQSRPGITDAARLELLGDSAWAAGAAVLGGDVSKVLGGNRALMRLLVRLLSIKVVHLFQRPLLLMALLLATIFPSSYVLTCVFVRKCDNNK